jgi:hypothetical protein
MTVGPQKEGMHLPVILHGQAADILHCPSWRAKCEDTIRALNGQYEDHPLTAAFQLQLIAKTQVSCELIQDFTAAVE